MIVVVIVGLLATLAIPAFQKVRNVSQDKAVFNNARQLGDAADQYFLEFGVPTVSYTDLVGSGHYVKSFQLVAQEIYPAYYTSGVTVTISNVGGFRTVTYSQ
jgi:type IV pilus assembly protein PilA